MRSESPADDRLVHPGIVQSIRDGKATIAVATSGCGSCGQRSGCGMSRLAGGGKAALVELPAPAGLAPGDRVSLGIRQSDVHRAALLGYLLPAVLVVAGAVLGDLAGGDAAAAAGAALGLAAGLAAGRIIPRLRRRGAATYDIDLEKS